MSQNILSTDYNMNSMDSSMNNVKTTVSSAPASGSSSNNGKLMRGILIGGAIGGVLAMLDSSTRTKVKDAAVNVKDTSMNMFSEVKNNPSDVKDQMVNSFKDASKILKEAISDAQSLYEKLNQDMFGKVGEVKQMTSQAVGTAMEAKEDLAEIGSKVKEAGSTVMDNKMVDAATGSTGNSATDSTAAGTSSAAQSSAAGSYATGMESQPADTPGLGNTANTLPVFPEDQNNDNNR